MAGYDKTKPSRNDSYINAFDDVRAKDDALAVMFNGVSLTNVPINAVNFSGGVFGLWNGSSFVAKPVAIAGGGTGATTATAARAALSVTSSTDLAANYLSKAGNLSGVDPASSRTTLDVYGKPETYTKTEVNNRTPDATTAVKGLVQLNNTLTSTSTILALTAAQGKVLGDRANVGYYNSETLSTSNVLTSGGCKVVRVGDMITISGSFNHTSRTSASSLSGYLPVWARPQSNFVRNTYEFNVSGVRHQIEVQTNGSVVFTYSSATVSTSGFTISYTF